MIRILLITLLYSPFNFADDLSAIDRQNFVRKCYAQLTSQRISSKSDFLKRAKGLENPVDICMDILDSAMLQNSGQLKDVNSNFTGQKVIQNLHRLHNSFFKNSDFEVNGIQVTRTVRNHFDTTQHALYITKALFSNFDYSYIVKTNKRLEAIRTNSDPKQFYFNSSSRDNCNEPNPGRGCSLFTLKIYNPNAPVNLTHAPASCKTKPNQTGCQPYRMLKAPQYKAAPRGKLLGVREASPLILPHGSFQFQTSSNRHLPNYKTMGENLGGGILGDQIFIMSNFQHPVSYKTNGTTKVPRNWAKAIYEDLLCRQLPALRPTDVGFLISSNPDSASFRWSTNCLSCHASMDQTAGNLRNVQYILSAGSRAGAYVLGSVREKPWTINDNATWLETANSNFSDRSPKGRLFYRSYDGSLVHETSNNISDLGQKISNKKDFYMCAAKNYYKHFMNVDLPLNDSGAPGFENSDPKNREELIRIGLKFMEHKKLRKLIRDIFESPAYFKGLNQGGN